MERQRARIVSAYRKAGAGAIEDYRKVLTGMINAVAGGGTFLSFGALTLVGIPPVVANATSSITQFPGYITSTLAYWDDFKTFWRGAIALAVNGAERQRGDLHDMIWDVPSMIAFLTTMYELLPGDLIFSGTPAGVGKVVTGDRLDGSIAGLTPLAVDIVA